jgi:hypothetical protein
MLLLNPNASSYPPRQDGATAATLRNDGMSSTQRPPETWIMMSIPEVDLVGLKGFKGQAGFKTSLFLNDFSPYNRTLGPTW